MAVEPLAFKRVVTEFIAVNANIFPAKFIAVWIANSCAVDLYAGVVVLLG